MALAEALAALALGITGGFIGRTGEISQERNKQELDAFTALIQGAAAVGETEVFQIPEIQKAAKRIGVGEDMFGVLSQVAQLPIPQERRAALLQQIITQRTTGKRQQVQAERETEIVEQITPENITQVPPEQLAVFSPPAVQARGEAQKIGIERTRTTIQSRLADIEQQKANLLDRIEPGKLRVQEQLAKVAEEENKIRGQVIRANLVSDLTVRGGLKVGDAMAIADSMLTGKPLDKRLAELAATAKTSISDATSLLTQSHNRMQEANKIIAKLQQTKAREIDPAEVASDLSTHNTMVIEAADIRGLVEPMTRDQRIGFMLTNLRFLHKGKLITLVAAIENGISFSELTPNPAQFGFGEDMVRALEFLKKVRGQQPPPTSTPGQPSATGP